MQYLAQINWPVTVLFSVLVLAIALFGLALSGHFPVEHQKPELKAWHGRLLLTGSIITVALGAANGFGLALEVLPAPIAIIAAGGALLAAPLVLQRFPDSFVDGRRGLVALAAVVALLAWLCGRVR